VYETYWGLTAAPFQNVPDPKFFFLSDQHREGLARLLYTVRHNKGAALLVGEGGCGKTTTGMLLLHLYAPTGGKILFEGKDVTSLSKTEMKQFRKQAQLIFQDPYSSLSPRNVSISESSLPNARTTRAPARFSWTRPQAVMPLSMTRGECRPVNG
jgi:ABC-type microcin C transport system duplicated ATPase subunit YejF